MAIVGGTMIRFKIILCLIGLYVTSAQASFSKPYLFTSVFSQSTLEASLKANPKHLTSQIGAVIPLQPLFTNGLWFTQICGLFDSGMTEMWNVGLGYRHQFTDWTVGTYGFFDRQLSGLDYYYSQLAFGVELLGTDIEAHFNGYIPTVNAQVVDISVDKIYPAASVMANKLEKPLSGVDVEVGGNLLSKSIQGFLTYYHFNGKQVKAINGIQLRGQLNLTNYITLTGEVSYDRLRKHYWSMGIQLSFFIGSLKEKSEWRKKLTQVINRKRYVMIDYRLEKQKNNDKNQSLSYEILPASKGTSPIRGLNVRANDKDLSNTYKHLKSSGSKFIEIKRFTGSSSVLDKIQSIIIFSSKEMGLKPIQLDDAKPKRSQLIMVLPYDIQGIPACKNLKDLAHFITHSYWSIQTLGQAYKVKAYARGLGGGDKEPDPKPSYLMYKENSTQQTNIFNTLNLDQEEKIKAKKAKLEQCLMIQKARLGLYHIDLVNNLKRLGEVELILNHKEMARDYYKQALMIEILHYGQAYVVLDDTLINLGRIEFDLNNNEIAKIYLEQALAIQRAYYGSSHVEMATTLLTLGMVELELGHHVMARNYYNQVLGIQEYYYGLIHINLLDTLISLGYLEFELKSYQAAKNHLEHALAIQIHHYGANHRTLIETLKNLGLVELKLEHYELARNYYSRGLCLQTEHYGQMYIARVGFLSALGFIEFGLGCYESAKNYYTQALNLQMQHYGNNHIEIANTLYNLGLIEFQLNHFGVAKNYYSQVLTIEIHHYGPNSIQIVNTLDNLGAVMLKMEDYGMAIYYYNQALILKKARWGEDDIAVVDTLNKLSAIERELSKQDNMEELEKVLKRKIHCYGKFHFKVAEALLNLGPVALEAGYYTKAKNYYNRALKIQKYLHGQDSIEVADILVKLGLIASKLGHYKKAIDYLKQALMLQKTYYGAKHIHLASTLNNLGYAESKLEHYEDARHYLLQSLVLKIDHYEPLHIEMADVLTNLGIVESELGCWQVAESRLMEVLAFKSRYYGEESIQAANTLCDLGHVMSKAERYEIAKNYYIKALALIKAYYGEEHIEVSKLLIKLGGIHQKLACDDQIFAEENYNKALFYYKNALTIRESHYKMEHIELAEVLLKLGEVYWLQNNPNQALIHYNSALAVQKAHYGGVDHINMLDTLNGLGKVYRQLDKQTQVQRCLRRIERLKG